MAIWPNVPLKIGHTRLKVIQFTKFEAERLVRWGEFDGPNFSIRLYPDLPPSTIAENFIHEVMHALWWEQNIKDNDGEERTVTHMARGLTAVLADNPLWRDWLVGLLGDR